jgi:hypothetical protein
MTGELPPEEVEFLKDKSLMENEIFKLSVIENALKNDLEVNENLLEMISKS